jgi:hypothetical protein
MNSKIPDWKVLRSFRHSLVPLACCASVSVALGAPHTYAYLPGGAPLPASRAVALAEIAVQGIVTDS